MSGTFSPIHPHERIIVALDGLRDLSDVRDTVRTLAPYVGPFKIGLELFTAYGPQALSVVKEEGGTIMLDLKLHDIPETMKRAAGKAAVHGVALLTVHASAGIEALRAVVKETTNSPTRVLAVTVLTSHGEADVRKLFRRHPVDAVIEFARDAREAECHGIVCSPQELSALQPHPDLKPLLRVVPGVRPSGTESNDQKRTATPAAARAAGADYLVIGRPILHVTPPDTPIDAAKRIAAELAKT